MSGAERGGPPSYSSPGGFWVWPGPKAVGVLRAQGCSSPDGDSSTFGLRCLGRFPVPGDVFRSLWPWRHASQLVRPSGCKPAKLKRHLSPVHFPGSSRATAPRRNAHPAAPSLAQSSQSLLRENSCKKEGASMGKTSSSPARGVRASQVTTGEMLSINSQPPGRYSPRAPPCLGQRTREVRTQP